MKMIDDVSEKEIYSDKRLLENISDKTSDITRNISAMSAKAAARFKKLFV